jgi:hypothetical protein
MNEGLEDIADQSPPVLYERRNESAISACIAA